MSKAAPPSYHARTRRDILFQNNLPRKPMPVAEDQGVQSRYSMHIILHLIRLLAVSDSRSISPTGHVSSRQPNPTKSLVSSSKSDQHVFCTRDGVCVTSPCASVNPFPMHAIPVASSTAITRPTGSVLIDFQYWGHSLLQHTTLRPLFVCAILEGSGPGLLE
jgi:hypothetical protein